MGTRMIMATITIMTMTMIMKPMFMIIKTGTFTLDRARREPMWAV